MVEWSQCCIVWLIVIQLAVVCTLELKLKLGNMVVIGYGSNYTTSEITVQISTPASSDLFQLCPSGGLPLC